MMSELILTCQVCKKPIADKTGYLWIDENEYLNKWQSSESPEKTGLVKWQAHHEKCDPDIDAMSYTIEVERIRTYEQLLKWTAHLYNKNWFYYTNWVEVVAGVLYGPGFLRAA